LHAADIWEKAGEAQVPSGKIRLLEAAYLVSTYLKCVREHNHERARFVTSTLALRRRNAA
jgi:hypothetical protein